MTHLRLGELLVQAGALTPEKLERALHEQAKTKQRLGRILVDHHLITESEMVDALARVTGLPRLDIATVEVEPTGMRSLIDSFTAEREGVVPLHSDPKRRALVVAVADPTNVVPLDDLAFRSSLRVEAVLGTGPEIEHLINHVFHNVALDREFTHRMRQHEHQRPVVETVQPLAEDLLIPDELAARPEPPLPFPTAPVEVAMDTEPSLSELFGPMLMVQENLARELQAVFELLVEKGWMTREQYLERLSSRAKT